MEVQKQRNGKATKASKKNGQKRKILPPVRPVVEAEVAVATRPPPGFIPVSAVDSESPVATVFLYLDRRGMKKLAAKAGVRRYVQRSFRGAMLVEKGVLFRQEEVDRMIVGRLPGDHFEQAQQWVERTVLDDLHAEFLSRGPGTAREREQAQKAFFRARDAFEVERVKYDAAQEKLDEASKELVRRFGNQMLDLGDGHYDPSFAPGEKVYWRRRRGQ